MVEIKQLSKFGPDSVRVILECGHSGLARKTYHQFEVGQMVLCWVCNPHRRKIVSIQDPPR